MRISEVANKAGLRPSALRYYERIGLLPPPMRVNGRRSYGPNVLLLLTGIAVAKHAGFTVEEIKHLFYGFPNDVRASARWSKLAGAKMLEVDRLIERASGDETFARRGTQLQMLRSQRVRAAAEPDPDRFRRSGSLAQRLVYSGF